MSTLMETLLKCTWTFLNIAVVLLLMVRQLAQHPEVMVVFQFNVQI